MAETLVRDFPEVITATRLLPAGNVLLRYEDEKFLEERIFFADSTIFDVFTIPLIQGDAKTALTKPNSIVMTDETAEKYFGSDNAMGKMITGENGSSYLVTGVAEKPPETSHFHFDFLASFVTREDSRRTVWLSNYLQTYFVLQENFPPEQLENKFPELVIKYVGPEVQTVLGFSIEAIESSGDSYGYFLQPLLDIHLYSHLDGEIEENGNATYVYIVSVVAVFILLIASINFMNLATARSAGRAKEVGVRKALGSRRSQLIRQFLTESILITFISLLLAIAMVELLLPVFNNLIDKQLGGLQLSNWLTLAAIGGIGILVGTLAGSYPAFFLAAFRPASVLGGKIKSGLKGSRLRGGLVIFQFAIAITLFVGTFIVAQQMGFIQNKDLGYNKGNVLVIERANALGEQQNAFKQELLQQSGVAGVAFSNQPPGRIFYLNAFGVEGRPVTETFPLYDFMGDHDFIETLDLELAAGRSFSPDRSLDSMSVLINEAAVQMFGFEDPIGQSLLRFGSSEMIYPIIGVLKDFHYQSLHEVIKPMVISILPNSGGSYAAARISPENVEGTLRLIENQWREFVPDQPFDYYFLEDDLANLYENEERTGIIVTLFSILAIFIAGLGLFGLASFTAEQRTKEIGVRKVLGASATNIVTLLSKEIVVLVLIASAIALPLAWYGMGRWLENFAFRISLGIGTFILAGVLALAIALTTVSFRAVKAALANPVDALRYE